MKRTMLKSKIHNATVTYSNLDYEGSLTIDEDLMKLADLVEFEKIAVVNKTTGARFETYVIKGEAGSKVIGLNGGAARLGYPGDKLIIFSFVEIDSAELTNFSPRIVRLDENNKILNK